MAQGDGSIYELLPLLVNWEWTVTILLLVSFASIGCGLVISAFSWHSRPTASFLLPLFMMAQILFSVPIVVSGSAGLTSTYGKFHIHSCEGAINCEGVVESVEPPLFEGYLCRSCRDRAKSETEKSETDKSEKVWVWEKMDQQARQSLRAAITEAAAKDFAAPPGQTSPGIAKGLSYFTLSRWGDMALRGTATSKGDADNFRDYLAADLGFARTTAEADSNSPRLDDNSFAEGHCNSRIWYLSGLRVLILLAVTPPLLVLLVLFVQERLARVLSG
jgi:hypothetical protein